MKRKKKEKIKNEIFYGNILIKEHNIILKIMKKFYKKMLLNHYFYKIQKKRKNKIKV